MGQAGRVVLLPLDGVVHTLLPAIPELVQLDVVLDEGVREQAEHQQHQGLGRAVQHRAQASRQHHQHLPARGEPELWGGSETRRRSKSRIPEEAEENGGQIFYQLEEPDPDHRLLFFLLTSVWKRRPGSFHINLRLNASRDSYSQMFTHFSLSLEAVMVLREGNEKTLRGARTKPQRLVGVQPVWIYSKCTKRLHACVYAANELQEYKDKSGMAVF